jgi:hypothetical protein
MSIDNEEKFKLVTLSCIGTVLLGDGRLFLGFACFAVLVPWSSLARVTAWLVDPLMNWRMKRSDSQAIIVQAEARPL